MSYLLISYSLLIYCTVLHPYYKLDYIVDKWGGKDEQENLRAQGVKDAIDWNQHAMEIFEKAVRTFESLFIYEYSR